MLLYVHTHLLVRLIRDGRMWRKREIIYLSLHCHHQNDSCIKTGSDEDHFNASLILRNSHKTVTTNFEEKRGPKRNSALLLTARPNRLTTYRSVRRQLGSSIELGSGVGFAQGEWISSPPRDSR